MADAIAKGQAAPITLLNYSGMLKVVRLGAGNVLRFARVAVYAAAHSTSFATVFMLRAVPVLAAGIFSFELPIPFA